MTRQLLLWSLWAAALAALAVGNLVPSAAAMRLRPSRRNRMEEALFSWLRPLPGAWPARQRWLAGAAVGVAVVVWGWDFGPVVAVAGAGLAAVTAIVLGRLERGQERARRIRLCRQAPSGLEAMAACLDAGLPLRQAVAVVAKLSPPDLAGSLRVVVSGIGVGLSDAEAWRGLADNPVLGTVARDVARATDWGAAVSSLLADAAAELRRQTEAELKTRARTVGVRTVLPLTLCYLPAFILLGIVPVFGSGFLRVLLGG